LLTIRKFTSRKLKMDDLVSQEFITPELAARLQEAVHRGDNILVSGGTGTGKSMQGVALVIRRKVSW
jgi:pilus assembly protein CpaF